jgi:serine/threonine protein kinase
MSADPDASTELGPTVRALFAGQVVFGRYELRRKLGEGGFGAVWLAFDNALREEIALKFVLQSVAASPEAIDALKREAARSRRLTHHNIVRIHDFVSSDRDGETELAGISMEYVEGESLAQRRLRERDRCFDVEQIAPWIDHLCQALTYAHAPSRRVIHRDLKPANLLLSIAGELKVADFGIACSLVNSVSLITGRTRSGTPPFMSPQQLMGDYPGESDDIYALGATIYNLLTGTPPFYQGEIHAQVISKLAPPMHERRARLEIADRPPIPPAWEETVAACLAKEVAERPPSVADVARRLQAGLTAASAPAATPAPAEPIRVAAADALSGFVPTRQAKKAPAPPTARRPRPRWLVPVLSSGVALLAAAALVWTRHPVARPAKPPASPAPQASAHSDRSAADMKELEELLATVKVIPVEFANPSPASPPMDKLARRQMVRLPVAPRSLLQSNLKASYGYIDEKGDEVIPAQWDGAEFFSDGLARVKKGDKYDYIDPSGRLIGRNPSQEHYAWDEAGSFSEGLAPVATGGKWGFIDDEGQLAIPAEWEKADSFSQGLARVERAGLSGFIDTKGRLVIPAQWKQAGPFSEGLAWVRVETPAATLDAEGKAVLGAEAKFGFIDPAGKLLIPAKWDDARPFSEGLAAVKTGADFGYIDSHGELVIAAEWRQAGPFSGGLAPVQTTHFSLPKPKGTADSPDPPLLPELWRDYNFKSLTVTSAYGFIDRTGKVVIPAQWDKARSFSGDLAPVGKIDPLGYSLTSRFKSKWGLADAKGEIVIPLDWGRIDAVKAGDGKTYFRLSSSIFDFGTLKGRWVDSTGRTIWSSK